ncbi:MAG: hypothetical protein H7240_08800 [Glaciimonas sp.]|nr:hypothetical protein [Glaciimonas sp.]
MPSFPIFNSCRIENPGQQEKIRELLAWQFGVDAALIDGKDNIVEQFYGDSLELLDMCLTLNATFGIDIGPQELRTMEVVGDVYRVVARLWHALEEVEKTLPYLPEEEFVSCLAAVRVLK